MPCRYRIIPILRVQFEDMRMSWCIGCWICRYEIQMQLLLKARTALKLYNTHFLTQISSHTRTLISTLSYSLSRSLSPSYTYLTIRILLYTPSKHLHILSTHTPSPNTLNSSTQHLLPLSPPPSFLTTSSLSHHLLFLPPPPSPLTTSYLFILHQATMPSEFRSLPTSPSNATTCA